MGRVVVDVKDFSFKYRQTKHKALKNVSFQVEEGSFFCIIGSNGSGKSTLCNALVGLIPHYFVGKMSGSVTIDGSVVEDSTIADLSTKIGLVFQNPFNQLSYTAGTVAEIPSSIMSSGRTLAIHMYSLSKEGLYTDQAYATAVVLLIVVVLINMLSNFVAKKFTKK